MLPLALLAAALALPASAQKPPKPGGKPALELVDLTAVDLNARPDLAEAAASLTSVFQIFIDQRGLAKPKGRAPASPEEPWLLADCTGSYIGGGRVATARHCGAGIRWDQLVLRRWLYKLENGRLSAAAKVDYRVRPEAEGSYDLAILTLVSAGGPAFPEDAALTPARAGEPAPGTEFFSLGYPNEYSARPFAAVGCRVLKEPADSAAEYRAACRITGGMSGGPQIARGAPVQIGVNSSSHGDETSQPRLSAP